MASKMNNAYPRPPFASILRDAFAFASELASVWIIAPLRRVGDAVSDRTPEEREIAKKIDKEHEEERLRVEESRRRQQEEKQKATERVNETIRLWDYAIGSFVGQLSAKTRLRFRLTDKIREKRGTNLFSWHYSATLKGRWALNERREYYISFAADTEHLQVNGHWCDRFGGSSAHDSGALFGFRVSSPPELHAELTPAFEAIYRRMKP